MWPIYIENHCCSMFFSSSFFLLYYIYITIIIIIIHNDYRQQQQWWWSKKLNGPFWPFFSLFFSFECPIGHYKWPPPPSSSSSTTTIIIGWLPGNFSASIRLIFFFNKNINIIQYKSNDDDNEKVKKNGIVKIFVITFANRLYDDDDQSTMMMFNSSSCLTTFFSYKSGLVICISQPTWSSSFVIDC